MEKLSIESRVAKLEQEVASLKKQLAEMRIDARIQRSLDQADRGLTRPARDVLEDIRRKYKIEPR